MRLRSRRFAAYAAFAGGIGAYAWWATGRRPFTDLAALAVVGAGLIAMTLGQHRRVRTDTGHASTGTIGWFVLLGALVGWQLLAYAQEPRSRHPTLSSLVNAALDSHDIRALAFVAWLVGAFRLARR